MTVQDAREQTLRTIVDHLLVRKARLPRPVHDPRHLHVAVAGRVCTGVPTPPGWTPYELPGGQRTRRPADADQLSRLACPSRAAARRRCAARRCANCCSARRCRGRRPTSISRSSRTPSRRSRRRASGWRRTVPTRSVPAATRSPTRSASRSRTSTAPAQYRATEKGAPIDASGNLDGKAIHRPDGPGPGGARQPGRCRRAWSRRLYSYGTRQAPSSASDKPCCRI